MSSNNASSLIPLDEYFFNVFSKYVSSKDFVFNPKNYSRNYDGSLTLVNYKPMATSAFETSPGYMPFILELSVLYKEVPIRNPEDIEVKYGEKG